MPTVDEASRNSRRHHRPRDATVDALIGYYRAMAGGHPDWDQYRAAIVAERRLLLTLRFDHSYGWSHTSWPVVSAGLRSSAAEPPCWTPSTSG